jgi:hypothetical protein
VVMRLGNAIARLAKSGGRKRSSGTTEPPRASRQRIRDCAFGGLIFDSCLFCFFITFTARLRCGVLGLWLLG